MEKLICLLGFMIYWSFFSYLIFDIYDRICYYVLDKLIKNTKSKKDQKIISKILGA